MWSATPLSEEQSLRRDWPHLVLIVVALSALYLATAPRTVVLEDDSLFVLSAWFLGVEHPPGYPLYVLLGKLATLTPLGSPAWRVHALSGLFGALACAVLFLIARALGLGRAPAYLAALGLGVSAVYWSQAIIADVYSLHALLLFTLLLLSLRAHACAVRGQDLGRLPDLTALISGLGLANHWPLLLLSAPGLALLWWPALPRLWCRLPRLLLWLAVGLLPYVWLVWRSQMQPPISFQGPLDSWREVLEFLLRGRYSGVDDSLSAGPADKLSYALWLLRQAAAQLTLPGGLLALLGFLEQWRRWGLPRAAALALVLAGPTLLLLALLDFDYDALHREAFRVYPVAAWGVLALWAGLGLTVLAGRVPALRRRGVAPSMVAMLLTALLIINWTRNDRADDWLAEALARQLLNGVPYGGTLLIAGDVETGATGYLHLVQGLRPDLTLLSEHGFVLEPKLFDPVTTPRAAQREAVDDFVVNARAPVSRLAMGGEHEGRVTWLLATVDSRPAAGADVTAGTGDDGPALTYGLPPDQRALLLRLVANGPFSDGWSEVMRRMLLTRFVVFRTRAELAGQWQFSDPELDQAWTELLRLPEPALMRAALLSDADHKRHFPEIEHYLKRFAAQADSPWVGKKDMARFYNLSLRDAQLRGDVPRARESRMRSLRYWPETRNPAYAARPDLRAAEDAD